MQQVISSIIGITYNDFALDRAYALRLVAFRRSRSRPLWAENWPTLNFAIAAAKTKF
jgi:hypothetical protein